MKVKELIEKLKTVNQDAYVYRGYTSFQDADDTCGFEEESAVDYLVVDFGKVILK